MIRVLTLMFVIAGLSLSQEVFAQRPVDGMTQITVQLNWMHQFQFAAFYAARSQGFYRDRGLEVILKEGGPDKNPVSEVISGSAQFGVANTGLIVDRYEGRPVVVLGALLQHSAIGLLARRDRGIETVSDLQGRSVQCFPQACDELYAYLRAYGLDPGRILDSRSITPDTMSRLDFVDATAVYLTNEGFVLRGRDSEFVLLLPRSAGVDLYGELLFTSEGFLKQSPEVVERFRQATFEGLRYAMEHPQEMINEILVHYNTQGKSAEHLAYEAQRLKDLVRVSLIEPGYMSEGRWRYVRDVYADIGRVAPDFNMQGMLYDFNPAKNDLARLTRFSLLSIAGFLLVAIVAGYIFYLNRRLRRSVRDLDRLNAELTRTAHYDPLTDVPNRILLTERMNQVYEMARRRGFRFAVLMLDLDRFKPINDLHGHPVGDEVLRQVARRIRETIRKSDTIGRFGGDEFVILLSEVDGHDGALIVADKIHKALEPPITVGDGLSVSVGACTGIAMYPDHGTSIPDLVRNADVAMYHAKEAGGDCAQVFTEEIRQEQLRKQAAVDVSKPAAAH